MSEIRGWSRQHHGFASRLLERTNEDWAKWQLCRYAEVATEVMCYAISRATNPATTPEALFEEGRPATFGHFLEKAKHLAGTAELDRSAWGVRFFSQVLKDTRSARALDAINQQRNNLAHGRQSPTACQNQEARCAGPKLGIVGVSASRRASRLPRPSARAQPIAVVAPLGVRSDSGQLPQSWPCCSVQVAV